MMCVSNQWLRHPALEDWKKGRGIIGTMSPKFVPEADLADLVEPKRPVLKLCTMTGDGNLIIPEPERKKWLADPVRSTLTCFIVLS